ncbi:hypothetical protein [Hymenobacter glacieicola]|uniref:Transmembrane protein n=1 Tax=Hymenobacter glacieicola TaxID=1562124 RepID=A0ABQ1WTR0_9BACT|nr:hypothetical protein [Hymenobacter glacieicola]GGG45344.1 hypothetical protein GCM10011378_21970 [Hymenobacter glacieicola]
MYKVVRILVYKVAWMLGLLVLALIPLCFIFPSLGYLVALVLFYGGLFLARGVAVVALAAVFLLLPLIVRWALVKLADLRPGPYRTALDWWVTGAYGLMIVEMTGLGLAVRPRANQVVDALVENGLVCCFWWLPSMLGALLFARVGFRRWYQHNRQG